MDKYLKTLRIQFSEELQFVQIPAFRGAIIATMDNANLLFHNHTQDGDLRYSYPLIQYKRIGGKAAIVCVGEGTEAIGEFFSNADFDIMLGNESKHLEVEAVKADKTLVQVWDGQFEYSLRKWLPFNQENYEKFKTMEGLADKFALMEQILVGNILSFAKGVGVELQKEVYLKIKNVENERLYRHKAVKKMGFDIHFSTNVTLPDFIGLGQGVSMGFGMVKDMKHFE